MWVILEEERVRSGLKTWHMKAEVKTRDGYETDMEELDELIREG